MKSRLLLAATIAALSLAASGAALAAQRATAACDPTAIESTHVLIDGNLYAYVRQGDRYDFGWSDKPVYTFPQAVRLIHLLGVKGTVEELLKIREPRGSDFGDAGSYSDLSVRCAGIYTTRFVTREWGFARFWLQQSRFTVSRSFCMPFLFLRPGAWVTTQFTAPLGRTPPRYVVDVDRDGIIDRRGTFKTGGKNFPTSTRC